MFIDQILPVQVQVIFRELPSQPDFFAYAIILKFFQVSFVFSYRFRSRPFGFNDFTIFSNQVLNAHRRRLALFNTLFKPLLEFNCGTSGHEFIFGFKTINVLFAIGIAIFGTVGFTDFLLPIENISSLPNGNLCPIHPFSID